MALLLGAAAAAPPPPAALLARATDEALTDDGHFTARARAPTHARCFYFSLARLLALRSDARTPMPRCDADAHAGVGVLR
jgi:hypothetical protein